MSGNKSQISNTNITVAVAQMMALLNDTDVKIYNMENQPWYQKMIFTVFGKNRATKNEIRNNHEKLKAYLAKTVMELYEQSAYDKQAIVSLKMQVTQVVAMQIELKSILGLLTDKLNQKIESVRDFNILQTEIDQGIYSENRIAGLLYVAAQLDERMLFADNQMGIITRALENVGIIGSKEETLTTYLNELFFCDGDKMAVIYSDMLALHDYYYLADIFAESIERYSLQDDESKSMIDKTDLFREILQAHNVNVDNKLSTQEIFNSFVDAKKQVVNSLKQTNLTHIESDGNNRILDNYQAIKNRTNELKDREKILKNRTQELKDRKKILKNRTQELKDRTYLIKMKHSNKYKSSVFIILSLCEEMAYEKRNGYEAVLRVLSEESSRSKKFLSEILSKTPPPAKWITAGGEGVWVDLAEGGGWKLQQNTIFKNVRIIDKSNRMRAFSINPNRLLGAMDELAEELLDKERDSNIIDDSSSIDPDAELTRLTALKEMLDAGAITKEEYEQKKKEILKRI